MDTPIVPSPSHIALVTAPSAPPSPSPEVETPELVAVEPYEQQYGEGRHAYHGFSHYRNMPSANRSIDKAWREHKTRCDHLPAGHSEGRRASRRWRTWAGEWGWVDRAAAWDRELDKQSREKTQKAQVDALERHARLAQGTLTALTAPVRATLAALSDPLVIEQLTAKVRSGSSGAVEVMRLIAQVAQTIPALVTVERVALGLSSERIEVDDKREFSFANLVAKDPQATELAVALLDRIAGTATVPKLLPASGDE